MSVAMTRISAPTIRFQTRRQARGQAECLLRERARRASVRATEMAQAGDDRGIERAQQRAAKARARAERENERAQLARERVLAAQEEATQAPDAEAKAAHQREVETHNRAIELHTQAAERQREAIDLNELHIEHLRDPEAPPKDSPPRTSDN